MDKEEIVNLQYLSSLISTFGPFFLLNPICHRGAIIARIILKNKCCGTYFFKVSGLTDFS